jgi:hypothetical protein
MKPTIKDKLMTPKGAVSAKRKSAKAAVPAVAPLPATGAVSTAVGPVLQPAFGRPSRSRELIYIYNYKLTDDTPKRIEFSRCMVRFLGFNRAKANPDLLWGVQGTTSLRDADRFAAADASFRQQRIFQLELAYRIPDLYTIESSISEESARRLGYLHCTRATIGYRNDLRIRMHAWLHADKDPDYATLVSLDFDDLVKQRPMLIHRLMTEDTFLSLVVHPVLLSGGVMLRVATVRNKPERIERVSTRFHESIQTLV